MKYPIQFPQASYKHCKFFFKIAYIQNPTLQITIMYKCAGQGVSSNGVYYDLNSILEVFIHLIPLLCLFIGYRFIKRCLDNFTQVKPNKRLLHIEKVTILDEQQDAFPIKNV